MGLFSRKRSRTEEAEVEADEGGGTEASGGDEVAVADDVAVSDDVAVADGAEEPDPDEPDPEDDELVVVETADEDDPDGAEPPVDGAGGASTDADAAPTSAPGGDHPADDGLVDTGQVEFELGDWGARERQLLDGELAAVRVRRAWEAGTLVVAASDADVVDDLIDYIEERIALDLSPDVEPVIYEVKDWPPGLEDRFLDLLIENRIAHMRGYQEITVGIDDEERVDDLVEQVTAAWEDEQPTDEELDGPDAQDVLSELFVSSDRLLHDPSDRAATVRFDEASESALAMGLPFGFDEAAWGAVTDLAGALRDQLADAEATDDDIVEAATALRSHLRPLV